MTDPLDQELNDAALDALFAEAQADAEPSQALLDRIVADAAQAAVPVGVQEVRSSLWDRALEAIGGWPSLSGLATAAVAGLYIGFSDPTLIETVGLSSADAIAGDVMFSDDVFFDDAVAVEG